MSGSKVEQAKRRSRHLAGTVRDELEDGSATFSPDNRLVLKFHGAYAQDDRDQRKARRAAGLEPDAFHMVRTGIPGGVLTGAQYLVMDRLADSVGNGTLRVTTRQDIQFHRVYKRDLRELVHTLTDNLVTTLAACGDVVRNTTACPAPLPGDVRRGALVWAQRLSRHFKPRTRAYFDVWIDGDHAVTALDPGRPPTPPTVEPLYGSAYLPRKFKIGFAVPGDNCTDVLINDLAIVPLVESGSIRAFTLFIGGGQGRSHNKPETYPRLASPFTTVEPSELLAVSEAIIKVHRDHGDRSNREHARLKYVVDDLGLERVREIVEESVGGRLRQPEAVDLTHADDHLGWHRQDDGAWFVGVKVASGRIVDRGAERMRSALRAVVQDVGASVRFTAREDVLLCDIAERDRDDVEAILAGHGVRGVDELVPVARHSFACPALPTCGLAQTESERVLPDLLAQLHGDLASLGLGGLDLHVRMTGCPNGCARPYTTEVAFVGRAKGRYDVHLGGDQVGLRLNEVYCENVPLDELVAVVRPVLERYASDREAGQPFGAWCAHVGVPELRAELGTEQWVRTR